MSQSSILHADELLNGYITSLNGCAEDVEAQNFHVTEAVKMIIPDILDVITKPSCEDLQPGIMDKMITFLALANGLEKEAKSRFTVSSLGNFLDFIINSAVNLEYRLEILKNINILLEHCAFSLRQTLLSCDEFLKKLGCLFAIILCAGDYEFQVCAIECLFRLIPKPQRAEIMERGHQSSSVTKLFLSIRDGHFETDCRFVLNKLNAQNASESSRVFSFPTESVKMDGEKIYKPSDDDYDQFWIDFNTGSKRVSLFIEPNFLQSQEGEVLWETVSLWRNDVARCDCTKHGSLWKAVIELKPGALIYNSKDPDEQSHLFIILVSTTYPFQEALLGTFGDSSKMTHGQQKASSVPSPLSISIRNPQPKVRTTKDISIAFKTPNSFVKPCHNLPPNNCSTPSEQNRCSAKTSVPVEPMRTPASSMVSSQSQESMWYKTEDKMKKCANEAKRSESDSLLKNKILDNSAFPLDKDHEQLEKLESKCSVSGPLVARSNVMANLITNQNRISPCDKVSAKSNGKNMSKPFQVTDKNIEHSQRKQHKPITEDFANVIHSNESTLEKIAEPQIPDRIYSIAAEEEDNSCSLRRSQRNINRNRGLISTEEKKQSDLRSENTEMKGDKNSLKMKKLNCKQASNKLPKEIKSSTKADDKSKFKVGETSFKESKTPAVKSLKSSKKTKTPVVTVQKARKAPDSKSEMKDCKAKEDSPVITTLISDTSDVRQGKDMNVHNHEMVQEPTISSVYEEKKREAYKYMRGQQNDKSLESAQAELLKSLTSPGCISEEDFKHPHPSFHGNHPEKHSRKEKREKKNQSKKSGSELVVSTDDKTQNNDGLEGEFCTEANIGEKKSPMYEGSKRVGNNSCNVKECNEYVNTYAMNLKEEGYLRKVEKYINSLDQPQALQKNCVERRKFSKDLGGMCLSNDELDNSKKLKTTFQTPFESLNDLKLQFQIENKGDNQGDILRENSKVASKSHTKSKIVLSHKDSFERIDHSGQWISNINQNDESQIYHDNEKESKIDSTKINTYISDRDDNIVKPSKINEEDSLREIADKKRYKINQALSVIMKSNSCEDVSSSNSGFLYIERSQADCDVIGETQCDKPTQQSQNIRNTAAEIPDEINSSSQIELTQGLETSNLKMHKLRKLNIEKIPTNFGFEENELNASGDFNLHNTEPQMSSNMESSYVFNKCGFPKKAVSKVKVKDTETAVNSAPQFSKMRDDTVKKLDSQNLCGTQKERIQNKGKDNVLSLPSGGFGDGFKISDTPEDGRPDQLGRQLRERNKKISYKEWESFESGISSKKSICTKLSPTDDKRKSQKDHHAMKMVGSMAPKKAPKENRQRKTFWTSREIKTTVTTTSYSKMVNSNCSPDPYNFEADCATTSSDAVPLLPFRSFTMNKSNSKLTASEEKQPIEDRRKVCHKTKTGHNKAQQENSYTTHDKMCVPKQKSHISRKSSSKRSKSLKKKGKKKACANESGELSLFSSQKGLAKQKKMKGSSKSSMEFGLFSSQKSQLEVSNTGSGLVFPPLEDSIPCTPYDEICNVASEDVKEKSSKKSALSECSWMKSKTPVAVREKMRGKTYNKVKARHLQQKANINGHNTEDETEQGPLYQRLYDKQHQKRPVEAKVATPQRAKVLGRLEMEITSGLSCPYDRFSSFKVWMDSSKDKVKKTVSSILTNSLKHAKNNSSKKSKRSLSFKSPSDDEYLTNGVQSDHEIHLAASHKNLDSPSLSITEIDLTKNKPQASQNFSKNIVNRPWEMLTSRLDHQIQGVLDKVSGCLDLAKHPLKETRTICSGPSSTTRPRRSFLKRKYAEQNSSCSDYENISGSECSQLENISMPRKSLKFDSPSQNIKEIVNDTCRTPKTPRKKLFSSLSYGDFPPLTPVRISGKKNASLRLQATDASPKKKKRKSQRKLELSPSLLSPTKDNKNNEAKSVPRFDLISCYLSSPEKGRECSQSMSKMEKRSFISPYMPLSMSIGASPVIGLSQLSSPELSDINAKELEFPPGPTALLDTIKDDLVKPLTSQQSDGSSEDYCTQGIAQSESSRSDMDLCGASDSTYASLRDYLTRKNMKKLSLVSELEDAAWQTVRCISSKWDDEQRKRVNAVKRFQNMTENVLACMSQDIREIAECEKAAVTLWDQQLEKLRKHRHSQNKELSKLINAHNELKEHLQENQATKNAHRDVTAVLKKDIESFKKKLEEKYNEHSLEAVKRCLQTSFLFS